MTYMAEVMTDERPSGQGHIVEDDTIVLGVRLVLPRVSCIPGNVLDAFILKPEAPNGTVSAFHSMNQERVGLTQHYRR